MRNRWMRLPVALGLAVLLPAALAVAEEQEPCTDEEGELVFEEVTQWVKAPENRLGNLGATDFGEFPTWSDEEPTASVFDGAGGGSLQQRAGNPIGDEFNREAAGHFEGTFTGPIDNMAVELYGFWPVLYPVDLDHTVRIALDWDGFRVASVGEAPVPVEWVAEGGVDLGVLKAHPERPPRVVTRLRPARAPLMVAAGMGRSTFQPGLQRGRRHPAGGTTADDDQGLDSVITAHSYIAAHCAYCYFPETPGGAGAATGRPSFSFCRGSGS